MKTTHTPTKPLQEGFVWLRIFTEKQCKINSNTISSATVTKGMKWNKAVQYILQLLHISFIFNTPLEEQYSRGKTTE